MLLKWAKRFCKDKIVLEIGCGTGIISEEISKISKEILCVDINPKAVEICRKKGLKCIQSDLFENVNGKYDVILFNPPYLPIDETEKDHWVRLAIYGGKKGNEVIKRFLKEAWKYLNENGIILLVFSSLSHPEEIYDEFKNIYNFEILEEINLFFEKLYCVKVKRIENNNH